MIAIYGIQDVDSEDHATELNWPLDSGNPVHPHKTARNQLPLLNQSALIKSTGKGCQIAQEENVTGIHGTVGKHFCKEYAAGSPV